MSKRSGTWEGTPGTGMGIKQFTGRYRYPASADQPVPDPLPSRDGRKFRVCSEPQPADLGQLSSASRSAEG
jgi:hypothetical protein